MSDARSAQTSGAINLRRLVLLRAVALLGQSLAVAAAILWFGMALPTAPIAAVLACAALVNVLTWWRLRGDAPVGDAELFAHLVFDVATLTAVLYFAGGATNPFAPLYLLPLTLAAAVLPARYTWAMTALTIACYSALLHVYVPLPQAHGDLGHDFQLHVLGMWLGFLLSAVLVSYFVVRMRETLRERDRLRAQMREQELRHERLLALGTLAAGAAHELSTPLSTMAVLAADLTRDPPALPEKARILQAQIERCRKILGSLSAAAGQTRAEGGHAQALDRYLAALVREWRAQRPGGELTLRVRGAGAPPCIVADQTLTQALLNVLNNAADVSASVELDVDWSAAELRLDIADRGPGLSAAAMEHAGEPFFSTKAPGAGMGLGLFLARGTIERMGGTLTLANRPGGGAVCTVRLPLPAFRVAAA